MNMKYNNPQWLEALLATNQKPMLTLVEFAQFAGITPSAAYKLTHKNLVAFSRPNGKKIYVSMVDALEFLQRNRVASVHEINNAAANYVTLNPTRIGGASAA
jgi:prophage regulatory protein